MRTLCAVVVVAGMCVGATAQAGINRPPELVSLTGDTMGGQGEELSFVAVVTDPDGDPITYSWNFGDGQRPVEALGLDSISYIYDEQGEYTLEVVVTDTAGATDSGALTIEIGNGAPQIRSMTVPEFADEGGMVAVSATATDPGGDILTYTWDFGDGDDAQVGQSVSHVYDDPETYTVTLTVEDPGAATDTDTRDIVVRNVPPTIVQFFAPSTTEEGARDRYSATAVAAPTDVLVYRWTFSDGSPAQEGVDLTEIEYAFDDEGDFSVTLLVTDDDDSTATRTHNVTVVNVPPRIVSVPSDRISVGREYVYTVEVDDPGDDEISIALEESPEGMTVEGGAVRWRITSDQVEDGPWPVRIRVSDGDGGSATQSWTLTPGFVDLDQDGVPDDCEEMYGLNPNDPGDALQDPDQDGRTNRDECNNGTNPVVFNGPTAPVLVGPVDMERVANLHPALVVENSTDPDGDELLYEFVVCSDEAFTEVVTRLVGVTEGAETTRWEVSLALTENAQYWWRSRAADPYVASAWSTGGSFIVDAVNDPPGVPNPIAPSGSADILSPEFSVDPVTDPEGDAFVYRFEVYGDAELTDVVASWTDSEPVSTPDEPFEDDRGYFWRAQSEDALGSASAWSVREAFHVNTDNVLPPAPVILEPADGSSVASSSVTLTWAAVDEPDNEPVTYEYQVSRDEQFTRTHAEGATAQTEVDLTELAEDSNYFVRVRALDPAGAGPYGTSTFLVNAENTPPGTPVLVSPVGVGRVDVGKPPALDDVTLIFEPAVDLDGDAVTHTITVMTDAGDPVIELEGDGEVDVSLDAGGYTWTVYARDAQGVRGEAPAPEAFVVVVGVNEPPVAPSPLSPVSDAQVALDQDIELVVVNGSDPEGAALTYMFAVYTSNSLAQPVWMSEEIAENPEGQTVAVIPAGTLESGENERFFWHVWATDDYSVGEPSATATFTRSLAPPVAQTEEDAGCGCGTASPMAPAPWFLALLGGLFLWRRRLHKLVPAAVLVTAVIGVAVPSNAEGQTQKEFVADSDLLPVGGSFVRGAYDAPVTVIEYTDFQCPYCARVQPVLRQLLDAYPGQVRLVFKHYPLPFHKDAPLAHEAALAAGAQGKFWEYHDLIFQNQRALAREKLDEYAEQLGLDMTQFRAALDQRLYKLVVDADVATTAKVGVRGTPGFFINGKYLSGARPYDQFKAAVDEELAAIDTQAGGVYAERVAKNWVEPAARDAKPNPSVAARPDSTTVYKVPLGKSPVRGPRKAEVTIVVFSDFQCPFCSRATPTLRQLLDESPNVRLVFKHNPLPFHKDARLAAIASLAAQQQGKFWEMHDLLFQNHKALGRDNLVEYAVQLGLNRKKFEKALDDKKLAAIVDADMELGRRLGARGVPAFFVDGVYFAGARPIDHFRTEVSAALDRSAALRKKGLRGDKLYAAIMKKAVDKPAVPTPTARPAVDPDKIWTVPVPAGAPVRGPASAKVTVIKFGDFQCPFCSRSMPTLVELERKYKGKIRIVYRHLPLPFHTDAKLAAQASMAANEQGKFWEYAALLYANQRALKRDDLLGYARQLQLDVGRFEKALDSGQYAAYVDADSAFAPSVEASGTPTFFINGRRLVGAQPAAAFEKLIDAELNK